jgi:hypothetical protein
LSTRGFIFDTLTWCSDRFEFGDASLDIDEWREEIRNSRKPVVDVIFDKLCAFTGRAGEEFLDAFFFTLMQGYPARGRGNTMEFYKPEIAAYLEHIRKLAMAGTSLPVPADEHLRSTNNLLVLLLSKRVAYTSSNRLGIVPTVARQGDLVCILRGQRMPFILRKAEDDCYHLVGEAYINDVMDGELMDEFAQGKYTDIDIVLV